MEKKGNTTEIRNNEKQKTHPGLILKKEREKRGLSIEEVSELTRVRPHYISAIESNDWENLPAEVFVRGFIRSYARALDLNEKELLSMLQINEPAKLELPRSFKKEETPRLKIYLGLFGAIIIIFGLLFLYGYLKGDNQKENEIFKESTQKQQTTEKQIKPRIEEPDQIVLPEDILQTNEPKAQLHTLQCLVRVRTWMRVKIDDNEPREFIFEPGARLNWKAKKGFDLLIGNAGGVELSFDGKPLGPLGKIGQVVKLLLPENFNVEEE